MTQDLPIDNADVYRSLSNNSTIPSIPLFPVLIQSCVHTGTRGGIDDIEAEQNHINEDEDSNVINIDA